jgi:hypothetical protein
MTEWKDMEEKGILIVWLEKIFGKSWKTSLCGVLIVLPQILSAVQTWCINIGVTPSTMNSVSLLFAALAAIAAKSQDVTGTNRPPGTGEPGPVTAGKGGTE